MAEIRVRLDEGDLRALLAGDTVNATAGDGRAVAIILADIGFDQIQQVLDDVINGNG